MPLPISGWWNLIPFKFSVHFIGFLLHTLQISETSSKFAPKNNIGHFRPRKSKDMSSSNPTIGLSGVIYVTRWWFQIFSFSPLPGEDSHFDEHFSDGLVQPPTRLAFIQVWDKAGWICTHLLGWVHHHQLCFLQLGRSPVLGVLRRLQSGKSQGWMVESASPMDIPGVDGFPVIFVIYFTPEN